MAMGTPIYAAPASTNEPTVDHEPSVSSAARRAPSDEHQSRSSRESSEHGGLLHQLLPQTSSSRQRSFRSPDAAVAAVDDAVGGRATAGERGGRGVVRRDRGGQRRRRGVVVDATRHRRSGCGRAAGGGPAVERPQGVPAVARQLAGEHRAGEPAPPVGSPEVQQRQAGAAEGPRARASSGGAVPGAAIRRGRLLHPLGKLGR